MKKKSKTNGTRISDKLFDEALEKALKAPKRDVKIRVNTFIDLDIYQALNNEAKKSGQKYQTLLNKYLRAAVLKEITESDIKALKIALSN